MHVVKIPRKTSTWDLMHHKQRGSAAKMAQINGSILLESNITLNNSYFLWDDPVFVWLYSIHLGIIFFGIIGSILSLVTLSRYKRPIGLELMLMYLAVADLGLLVSTAVQVTYVEKPWARDSGAMYIVKGKTGAIVVRILYLNFKAMGIYAVIYLSLERHIAICRPFLARRFCTPGTAKLMMIWITAGVVLYYLFKDIEYIYGDAHWSTNPHYASTVLVFRRYLDPLFVYGIPLPLLFVLNVKLLRAIMESKKNGHTRTTCTQRALGPALSVAAVLGVFLVTQTANMAIFIYLSAKEYGSAKDIEFRRVLHIRNICISLNASLNFVIYCVLSHRFRSTLKNIFNQKDDLVVSRGSWLLNRRSSDQNINMDTLGPS